MTSMISYLNDPSRIANPPYRHIFRSAVYATQLSAIAALIPFEPTKIVGTTVLTGVFYGVINDMFACRDCIEYFTIRHFYDGTDPRYRLIRSLNPNLNALAWGMAATWPVTAAAGSLLAVASRMPFPGMDHKVTTSELLPLLTAGAAITLVISHIFSRVAQQQAANNPNFNLYRNVPQEFQAKWHACNVRNSTGYAALAIGGIFLTTFIITSRLRYNQAS